MTGILRRGGRPDSRLYEPAAVARYKAIIEETRDASDEESLIQRALAYWMLGRAAVTKKQHEDAPYSGQAASLATNIPALRAVAVSARAREGVELVVLGRDDEALEVLDEVIADLPNVPYLLETVHPELRNSLQLLDTVANAAGLKVDVLGRNGRVQEADEAAEFVIHEFQLGETSTQQLAVAKAFLARAQAARERGDADQALEFLKHTAALSAKDSHDRAFRAVRRLAKIERQEILQSAG